MKPKRITFLEAVKQIAISERLASECDSLGLLMGGDVTRRQAIERLRELGIIEPVLQHVWEQGQVQFMEDYAQGE